jgi:formylglycine-generating enzyme required for sulfatase activity
MDGLRHRDDWLAWRKEQRLEHRVSGCAYLKLHCETRLLVDVPSDLFRQTVLPWCEDGLIPTTIHVRCDPQGNRFITSVWEGNARSPADESQYARRVAGLALALGHFGQSDAILDGLRERWGRTVRTALIEGVPKVMDPPIIIDWIQGESSAGMQANYLEILGQWPVDRFNDPDRSYLMSRVPELASNSTDARVANVARWCCTQWDIDIPKNIVTPEKVADSDRNWYVNALGQQMVIVRATGKKILSGRDGYQRVWTQLERDFAILSTEVPGEDYAEFLKDPRVQRWIEADPRTRSNKASLPGTAQREISWDIAIHYCQWLNEKDGVPEDQWCYDNLWQADPTQHPVPRPDNLSRTGYRLPTHAEWIYACMSGATTPWHFGSEESHIGSYEWTLPHSENRPQAVARLRPNAFGLFDMGGNLTEWTEGPYRGVSRDHGRYFLRDIRNSRNSTEKYYVNAGGRFRFTAQSAVSDNQSLNERDYVSISTGMRVARTVAP